MAARLGETRDPRELIPGNPSKLNGDADRLDGHATTLEGIGDELGSVRVPGWHGQASEAFWEDFSGQKKKWYRGADALSAAARALRDFAGVLEWAQGQAEQAILLYESGDENGGEQLLETTRGRVKSAGDTAAGKFKAQGGGSDDAPDWLFFASEAAQDDSGLTTRQFAELEGAPELRDLGAWGNQRNLTQEQRDALREHKGPGIVVGGPSVSGNAKVWGAEAKGHGAFAGGDVSGTAGVNLLGVEGSAGVGLLDGNATAQASGKAYLAQATAEGKYEAGLFATSGKAEVFGGAEAGVKGSVGTDGVHVGGEAFAGAKATAEGHASVAGVGVGGTAEAWAGAGAEAHLDAGMKDGKFVIGGDLGVGLGVGGKLGAQVEIDPGKITDTLGDAWDAIGDWGD
ncbi:putative T7SS-secreted protein [Streptomyces sp. enrichment culture]|uniref:putative T7SS-secreted protein n=1 Tax=Streptomyces sp. enrichment culture TaxID=1795815 RepID=UPI003F5784F8